MQFNYIQLSDKPLKGIKEKPWDLGIPQETHWNECPNKVMVILQHIPSEDLKAGKILGGINSKTCTENIFNYALSTANRHKKVKSHAHMFVGFNFMKTYNLGSDEQDYVNKKALARIKGLIKDFKPTKIVVIGDLAANLLLGEKSYLTTGCIKEYKNILATNTIPYDESFSARHTSDEDDEEDDNDLSDDAVLKANILGMVARDISNIYLGKNPFDLSHIKTSYTLIDTLAKFKKAWKIISKKDVVALDIEAANLSVKGNTVSSLQFSVDETHAYFIPYLHPDSPFSPKEIEYIKARLKDWLGREIKQNYKKPKYLIGQNISYDLKVLRQHLNIPFVHWLVWDTIAGEFCLDENLKVLSNRAGISEYRPFGLNYIFARYNNLFYYNAEFSKEQRHLFHEMPLTKASIEYGSMDTISIYAIHNMQIKRSKYEIYGSGSYEKHYKTLMLGLMSHIVMVMSIMEQRGVLIDLEYLANQLQPDSEFNSLLDNLYKELYSLPSVKKCNDMLLKESSIPTGSLWDDGDTWVFDLSTQAHARMLYFDVLKLEPVRFGKDGDPSMDKFFQKRYAEQYREVAILQELNKLNKLKSSYLVAIYKKLTESIDGPIDNCLRPGFGFQGVVTGRSNSFGPSLQQIPVHSKEAKYIKRCFITPAYWLGEDADYSSHEVRCWGIMSQDKTLLDSFRHIHEVIRRYRKKPNPRTKNKVETEGDSHKLNYSFFTGLDVKKVTKALRQIAKVIVFGSMYGKGATSLAKDIGKTVQEAKEIMTVFFRKFHKAKSWLDWTVSHSRKTYHVYSPFGRKRNLFGYMSPLNVMQAAMERRAQNSPIQGFASDIGFMSAYLYSWGLWYCYTQLGDTDIMDEYEVLGPNVMVHDSIKSQAPFKYFLLDLHIKEWSMTQGVQDYCKKVFNLDMNVPLGIDFDIGWSWANMSGWDWTDKAVSADVVQAIKLLKKDKLKKKGNSLTIWDVKKDKQWTLTKPLEIKSFLTKAELNPKLIINGNLVFSKQGDFKISDSSLTARICSTLKDHKELHQLDYNVNDTYEDMYKQYRIQCKKLKLNKRFPLNTLKASQY